MIVNTDYGVRFQILFCHNHKPSPNRYSFKLSENLSFAVEKMTDFNAKSVTKCVLKVPPKITQTAQNYFIYSAKPICPIGQNIWDMLEKKA